ncbi:hypothetical protein FGG08_000135 [Glutinoglossum americanum]|uniref:DNA damage-binding protein 1 n=1 Tax=Glutinoglossum americanum TaxID=1670608 RepID=A0A9P8IGU0_9PEZI|nr:hypothetical protein FGG08_000135 [Glutinoglossum americanum]
MAKNLRLKIPPSDTLIINDVNVEATRRFVDEFRIANPIAGTLDEGIGIEIAKSPREVVERSEATITMLPGTQHVKAVFRGILESPLLPNASSQPRIFIDCSTIDPASSIQVANSVHSARAGSFVDAPVSGGVVGAKAGTLTFMLGAPTPLLERIEPILSLMGRKVMHCGGQGAGLAGKLANNYLLAVSNIATSEAMNLGIKLGLDPKVLASLINASSGKCWSSEINNPVPGVSESAPASKGYSGGFGVSLMKKDLKLAISAAEMVGAKLLLHERAQQVYEALEADEKCRGLDFSVTRSIHFEMAYLAPIHRPTSIRHALKLQLREPKEDCLVIAQNPDGLLELQHSETFYGKITLLQKLRPLTSPTDHLFVGTDQFAHFTLSWDHKKMRFKNEYILEDLVDNTARASATGSRCLVDPDGRIMSLDLFEGRTTIIPLKQSRKSKKKREAAGNELGAPHTIRIPELFVRTSAFLHGAAQPEVALLWEDGHNKVNLTTRVFEFDGKGEFFRESDGFGLSRTDLDASTSLLIPVSHPPGGVLLFGETSMEYSPYSSSPRGPRYFSANSQRSIIKKLDNPTISISWAEIGPLFYLVGDEYGKLYGVTLDVALDQVCDISIETLGETPRASALVYLGDGYLFVGSHSGDSQLVRLRAKQPKIEVVQTLPNIAPILDFTVMDMGDRAGEGQSNEYSSGQARIISCSGAHTDGSLRSVRSGVGLEELGILAEITGIRDVYGLRSSVANKFDDILVVSFVDETRVFRFDAHGDVDEMDSYIGFSLSESTLVATNVLGDRAVQVTNTGAWLMDSESGTTIAEWRPAPGQKITAASANEEQAILSIGGETLVVLDIRTEFASSKSKSFGNDSQIACVTVPPTLNICVIGFWGNSAVSVFNLDTLDIVHTEELNSGNEASVPRSLLVTHLLPGQPPILFVAMADGVVYNFSIDPEDFSLSSKKSIVLGRQQANLRGLPRDDGLFSVFATCDHPSLIYGSEGRIMYSAVTAEKTICVCPFDAEAFPGSIVVATPHDLKISLIDTERTTHVRTLHVHETVRRVAYSPVLKIFGLGTIQRTVKAGTEKVTSHFKLVDEVQFKPTDVWNLNEDELVESITRADLEAASFNGPRSTAEHFIVGTCYLDDQNDQSKRGRIIVFEVTTDQKLKNLVEIDVKGACRCLSMFNGKIVAALTNTVVLYSYEYDTPSRPALKKEATYRMSSIPIAISVTNNYIAVADIMKSVSVVEYKLGKDGEPDVLQEVARHFQVFWSSAMVALEDDTFLQSDVAGNLMVLHRDVNGVTEDDRRMLKATSEIRLGELVNKIQKIATAPSSEGIVVPRAFIGTTEGAIYLFGTIRDEKRDLLMSLQSKMAKKILSPGNLQFNGYRAFRDPTRAEAEPYRFVDGDLVERFLDFDPHTQQELVGGLSAGVEEVKGIVESLRRLH